MSRVTNFKLIFVSADDVLTLIWANGPRVLMPVTTIARRSLRRILDDLGDTLLEPVAGAVDPSRPVSDVVIYDIADALTMPPHSVVLGVGIHDNAAILQLLSDLAQRDVAALVVRSPIAVTPGMRRVAGRSGVTLLGLTNGASWMHLAAMLRTLLAQDDVGEAEPEILGGLPSGDLFALANAIAALLDAPVTIEDRHSNVLAFSGRQDEADPSRVETVLGRRVPERYLREQESRGEFARLYRSHEPIYIGPLILDDGEPAMPRMAIAVRAGEEILGSIWAAVPEPLNEERTQAFSDVAKLVALHMLRIRAGTDVERRLRADLVSTALEGGPSAVEACGRLGILGRTTVVVALGLVPTTSQDTPIAHGAAQEADLQRVADAFSLHLTALQPGSAVALLGEVAYGLVPVPTASPDFPEQSTRIAKSFLERTGPAVAAAIGIGPVARDTPGLGLSRQGADRALRVLRHEAGRRGFATAEDVYIESLMLDLADLAAARVDTVSPPIARLLAYDGEHEAQLLATLRCWLEAFGDIPAAARSAYVHPNTFRYRLRRLREVSGLDLDNQHERFAAMLQLRLLDAVNANGH